MVHHGAPWAMGLEAGGVNSVTAPTGYGWVNGYSNGILTIISWEHLCTVIYIYNHF